MPRRALSISMSTGAGALVLVALACAVADPAAAKPRLLTETRAMCETRLPEGALVVGASAALRRLLCRVDALRADRGLRRLRWRWRLADAAAHYARTMVRRGFFAHVTPDGRGLRSRVRATGYLRRTRTWWIGEVLAWGTSSAARPAAVLEAWLHSSSHRRLLLKRRARDIGIGVAPGRPTGASWAPSATFVLLLGRRHR